MKWLGVRYKIFSMNCRGLNRNLLDRPITYGVYDSLLEWLNQSLKRRPDSALFWLTSSVHPRGTSEIMDEVCSINRRFTVFKLCLVFIKCLLSKLKLNKRWFLGSRLHRIGNTGRQFQCSMPTPVLVPVVLVKTLFQLLQIQYDLVSRSYEY